MGWACSTFGGDRRGTYRVLAGRSHGRGLLGKCKDHITRYAMYVELNIEARSLNHCLGKAKRINNECVFLALVTKPTKEHAPCYTVCGLPSEY